MALGQPLLTLSEENVEMVIKLRAYRISSERKGWERGAIESLVYQEPITGRVSLRSQPDGATVQADCFIKIWNPTGMWRNYISILTTAPGACQMGFKWDEFPSNWVKDSFENNEVVQKEKSERH